jgi:SNF2 family DNA or RNA helicase
MKIELYKIPIILDVANDALENGYSVVIFVCFKETLQQLAEQLNTTCLIYGGQSLEERNAHIDDFQNNRTNVLISMLSAGACGISLHDLHGGHPRMSIINSGWNGIELKQALGRIHRAGAKTPALQRLVFCANTYEDNICKAIEQKLKNIDSINDGEYDDGDIAKELMKQQEDDNIKFTKITEEEAAKIHKEDTTLKDVKKNKDKKTNNETIITRRKTKAAKDD